MKKQKEKARRTARAFFVGCRAGSVHHHRVLCQFGVAFQRVFHFFLGGRVLLPGGDALLEQFGPQAVQVDLFAERLSTISNPWRASTGWPSAMSVPTWESGSRWTTAKVSES